MLVLTEIAKALVISEYFLHMTFCPDACNECCQLDDIGTGITGFDLVHYAFFVLRFVQ